MGAGDGETISAPRRSLETAHRNGLRLLKLVNTLLEFARIEAGRAQASYEPTDLAALTAELASNFRSACERVGLQLDIRCPPLTEPAYVDRDIWERIVLNLLSNAFKYTLRGGITVSLEERGDRVELSVRDTGIGIPANELPRLFERFHRVEAAAGRSHEGSGIGLALVKGLVRLHGGTVQAASVPGEGSTFTVSLPLGAAHLPAERIGAARSLTTTGHGAAPYVEEALRWLPDELPDHGRNEAPAPGPQAPRARILWADDNADMREYVARLLGDLYAVEAVADGEAALAAMAASPPDLVLADIMMPRLDGIGLVRALRADERLQSIPVILLSARAGEEARIEGMQAGADDYLVKPFTARDLLARVGAHLQSARIRREAAEALRESETRFRNMADHSPVMIWITEPDASCSYLNRTWYEFTGQAPAAALGFGWVDAVHPEDRAYAHDTFVAANARCEAFRLEYRLRRHDGEYRFAIDAAVPRRGSGGEFLGYIGSVIDITELKRVEAELRETDRRKDEFLAMLGHELRNPLAPIVTAVDLLADADGDDAVIEQARGILSRQTRHLVRLVDDLLELSRISRGRIQLRMGDVALADVVAEAVEATRPLVSAARHVLDVDLPGEPLLVHADTVRLVQVIANLVNNATKYTAPGGRIGIRAWAEDGSAAISVRDNGIGIAPDMIDRVFEMFVQGHPLGSAYQAGLGIGLSLARTLVQMHGGSITARSDGPGRGSEFTVRLPLLASRGHEASVRRSVAARAGAPQRVLVVDDNVDAAQSIGALLGRMGHEVRVVHDGRSALETSAANPPDLVLLDIGLPDLDGLDVAARLRADPRLGRVRIVALTGHGREVDRERTRRAGFQAHLLKPVSPEDLREVLREPQPAADLPD